MGWLSDFFSNPVQTTWDLHQDMPGDPGAVTRSIYDGLNGDLSWNPWSEDRSVLDYGAQGGKISEDPDERQKGRMVGTAIGSYFTGGALSGMLGSTAAGGAASGALWGGAQAAGTGGDVEKGITRGAIGGGLGGALPSSASALGIDNAQLAGAWDGAVRGGVGAAATGGNSSDIGRGMITGAAPGLASYGASQMSSPDSYVATSPNQGLYNEMKQQSTAPGTSPSQMFAKEPSATSYVPSSSTAAYTNAPGQKSALSFESPALQSFMDKIVPQTPSQWGDLAQGLMGMYGGYKQRKNAKDILNSMNSNKAAYGQQLQQTLARRDAATGRRSDVGGRAVELQAKLAELDSRNAPAMAALQANSLAGLGNMFQSGLRYGGKSGWFGPEYTRDQGKVNPAMLSAPTMPSMAVPYEMQNSLDPTQGDPYSLNNIIRRNRVVGGE